MDILGATDGCWGPGQLASTQLVPYQCMQALGRNRRSEQTFDLPPLGVCFLTFEHGLRVLAASSWGSMGGPKGWVPGAIH